MNPLNLAGRVLDRLEETLIATLMAAATLLIFVAVVHRYLAGLPIPGLQDSQVRRFRAVISVRSPVMTRP